MGMPASQFYGIKDDMEQVKQCAQNSMLEKNYSIVLRAKLDESGYSQQEEGPKIRYTVVRSAPYDIKQDNLEMLKRLKIYSKM